LPRSTSATAYRARSPNSVRPITSAPPRCWLAGRGTNYDAIEDTLLWVIPGPAFRKAVESNGRFAAHFVDSLAKRTALAETAPSGASDLGELMLTKIGDALLGEAVIVAEDCAIDEATRRMRDKRVDCVFVNGEHGFGIATRTDLLEAIALKHRPLDTPVGAIASRPVVACSATSRCSRRS